MLTSKVTKILEDVRRRGDRAVRAALRRFDGIDAAPSSWRVPLSETTAALKRLPVERRRTLEQCAKRIRDYHVAEYRHSPRSWKERLGGTWVGQEVRTVDSVGAYVPGGRFAYPSTVLMTCIPARVAGVRRVVVCTPPRHLTDEVLAAAALAEADELFRIGGVAAVGALAYGTATVQPVDLIVGPGKAWVTEAKRQVFGTVGIDMLAGPSEIVILADRSAPADWVAADMMAQAEHDPMARSTLIALDAGVLTAVRRAVAPALRKQCRFVKVKDWPAAAAEANRLAPEHLAVAVKKPSSLLPLLRNAGAMFLGAASPVAAGDYWAGPSHVLPTARSARFSSGLSVQTFLKRSSVIEISDRAMAHAAPLVARFAESEGLTYHAQSARSRETL
ncbi:MAG: histidinol dehydrogenase [Elusimicrobia bacterium]|nr:histidinol dehydrogenase [Elusimicrobiota bacterium]